MNNMEEDISETCFFDEKWLLAYGLSRETALDYFACSPFYDPQSVNEDIKRQGLDYSIMKTTNGIQFHLFNQPHEPFLFVIHKSRRVSKHQTENLAWYYILDGMIYQAPTLERIAISRITKFSAHIHNAFDMLIDASRYAPSEGYTWDFEKEEYKYWKQPTASVEYERRRQARDEYLDRLGTGEVNRILESLGKEFLPNKNL